MSHWAVDDFRVPKQTEGCLSQRHCVVHGHVQDTRLPLGPGIFSWVIVSFWRVPLFLWFQRDIEGNTRYFGGVP